MVKIGAYVLQEFGHLTRDVEGKGFDAQFDTIHKHFYNVSSTARAILFNAYIKLALYSPSVREKVQAIFEQYKDHWEEDL
mmetsp:Transcript_9004/g.6771  ORF Transcript_9004/g.6771 Transcript_9004/m.6771 type:complete len:80 (+) Transcript_9004:319-558(+)